MDLDQYLDRIKTGNLTAKLLLSLGVLSSNAPSDRFFTATDIALHTMNNSGLGCANDAPPGAHEHLSNFASTVLRGRWKAKHQDLFRTTARIESSSGKAAYGYRMGIPVTASRLDSADAVTAARDACNNPSVAQDLLAAVKTLPVSDLEDLLVEIVATITGRLHEQRAEIHELRSRLRTISEAAAP